MREVVLNWHWVAACIILFIFCTLGMALLAKLFGKSAIKFIERKWLVCQFAANMLIYIIVQDGAYLVSTGGIILIVGLLAIILGWNVFEHISDHKKIVMQLSFGKDRGITISSGGTPDGIEKDKAQTQA